MRPIVKENTHCVKEHVVCERAMKIVDLKPLALDKVAG